MYLSITKFLKYAYINFDKTIILIIPFWAFPRHK